MCGACDAELFVQKGVMRLLEDAICLCALDVSFQQVVHPVQSGEADVARLQ